MSEGPLITLVFRAEFEQPIGALNPAGFKVSGPVPIEIYRSSRGWQARRVANPPVPLEQITPQPSAEIAKQQMTMYFKARLTEWTALEKKPPTDNPGDTWQPIPATGFYTDPAGRFRRKNSK